MKRCLLSGRGVPSAMPNNTLGCMKLAAGFFAVASCGEFGVDYYEYDYVYPWGYIPCPRFPRWRVPSPSPHDEGYDENDESNDGQGSCQQGGESSAVADS